ncbi:hypothetical protein [Ferrimonas sp. YFM]|uniref:hypothetical protein n=1 Tax=Ferrimonas sp. YFM TaxID=3028878 RepID=UPI0025748DCF|nr:hypothetical protein [Ferrimonas sp. YFM]
MIFEPKVSVVETDFVSDRTTTVEEVKLSSDGLEVIVESNSWRARVHFDTIYGFRVLDEGDLCEFWTECNLLKGWCFKVLCGGWNDLEKSRDHFVSGKLYEPVEFLIVGLNECVSVLAYELPVITHLCPSNKKIQPTPKNSAAD